MALIRRCKPMIIELPVHKVTIPQRNGQSPPVKVTIRKYVSVHRKPTNKDVEAKTRLP